MTISSDMFVFGRNQATFVPNLRENILSQTKSWFTFAVGKNASSCLFDALPSFFPSVSLQEIHILKFAAVN